MIDLLSEDFLDYVRVENLSEKNIPDDFSASITEYSEFLLKNALNSQNLLITNTYILYEKESNKALAFISLICDSVSFTFDEKLDSNLIEVPYSTFPAIKIAQLAVSTDFKSKFKNIGSLMLKFARIQAFLVNEYSACRFLTVDADIENNSTVTEFYEKNGFKRLSDKKYTKKTKICCMFKDILS